jgi:kumamolisin
MDVGTGNSGTSDSETILDICTASAVAPGATIQVYWGNSTTTLPTAQDWSTVIDRIWHNPQKGDPPAPQVLSISWTLVGGDDVITPGGVVSSALIDEISADFQDMANAGITILVASGDGGSLGWNNAPTASAQGGNPNEAHVAYPGSDPWVTSCGGTTLLLTSTGGVDQEWVWNDTDLQTGNPGATGGGISAYFKALPPWQVGIVSQPGLNPSNTGPGRGVPDVAGNASLNSGYMVSLSGMPLPTNPNQPSPPFSGPFCGTSAVAPLYAGSSR